MARKNRDIASTSTNSWLARLLAMRESAEITLSQTFEGEVWERDPRLSRACAWCYAEENTAMDASASVRLELNLCRVSCAVIFHQLFEFTLAI